ncbi:protein of unknown function [Bradyrhizobium vignae]|uniref:Uncharacterized protein n=1 Tax=Bradyrhizobium vignae TaxID=1549949 RepID=A0A2U3PXG1_9BRAD|nr:protein of unknown function [Bradyrhizobium vignae]
MGYFSAKLVFESVRGLYLDARPRFFFSGWSIHCDRAFSPHTSFVNCPDNCRTRTYDHLYRSSL